MPSTFQLFSYDSPPEIVIAPAAPFSLTLGERRTTDSIVRETGSSLTVDAPSVVTPCDVIETCALSAVTRTSADTAATLIATSTSCRCAVPRRTPPRVTASNPSSFSSTA